MPDRCWACGDCCRVLHCNWSLVDLHADESDPIGFANREFLTVHWHETTRDDAARLRPDATFSTDGHFYVCDQFDYETAKCKSYDTRPPICRDFPWYENLEGFAWQGQRNPSMLTSPPLMRCGYWLDVPAEQRPPDVRIDEILERCQ